ncbi:10540_t:CDS:2 [Gigaspora margarita]|uniref:10540_t:CDS:1 n=1 Tax=Gigaspora margarita TaxID=4874 RepID=A0ABN7UNX0_GIGMA|nr:10540_t:CDS:2 [Gigaspora margarita]
MLDHKNIDNYYLLQISSTDNMEVPVDCDKSNIDLLYEITDNKLLSEASVDSDESDIEASTNSVLENMASDFKEFDGKYGPYFPNLTSATIFTWVTKHMVSETCQHNVPLCINKTPSTYEATKKAFTISPLIHLERVLNNPVLISKLYFGPRIVTKKKWEFWHGEL